MSHLLHAPLILVSLSLCSQYCGTMSFTLA